MKLILALMLACPAMACTRWWVGGGSANTWIATGNTNWATSSGGANNAAVPTTTDDVCFDANSGVGNSVISATIIINSLTTTGYTGTLTHNTAVNLELEASLTLTAGMTYTLGNVNTSSIIFIGTTTGNTITTAGFNIGGMNIDGTGSWTLGGSLSMSSASAEFTVTKGTFSSGNFNISCGFISISSTSTRSVTLGTSTITLSDVGTVWYAATTTGLTSSMGSSTIVISNTGSIGKIFAGGGLAYGSFSAAAGGAGAVIITGANTFSGTLTATGPKTFTFPSSTTTTIGTLAVTGTSGNLVTINSSTGGTAATISQASGTVCANWVSLQDSTATGGASFFAQNATNVSGNTGWTFGSCPSGVVAAPIVTVLQ